MLNFRCAVLLLALVNVAAENVPSLSPACGTGESCADPACVKCAEPAVKCTQGSPCSDLACKTCTSPTLPCDAANPCKDSSCKTCKKPTVKCTTANPCKEKSCKTCTKETTKCTTEKQCKDSSCKTCKKPTAKCTTANPCKEKSCKTCTKETVKCTTEKPCKEVSCKTCTKPAVKCTTANPCKDKACATCTTVSETGTKPISEEPPVVEGHQCRSNKNGQKKCSGKSCYHCKCPNCNCPTRKRLMEEGKIPREPQQPASIFGSGDFFSYLKPSFRERMVDFIKENPQVFEYLPHSVRETVFKGLRGELDPSKNSFVENAKEKYADFLDFFSDYSGISSFISEKISNHTACILGEEEATFNPAMSAKLCAKERLTPIMIVPGLLGSALEERRTNATSLPAECYKSSASDDEWTRSWVSVASFLGFRCWNEVLKLSIVDEPSRHHCDGKEQCPNSTMRELEKRGILHSIKDSLVGFFSSVRDVFAPKSAPLADHSKKPDVNVFTPEDGFCSFTGKHPDFSHSLLKSKFPPGVEVRPLDDGIEATRCLDSSNSWTCQTTSYFKNLLSHVTKSIEPVQRMFDFESESAHGYAPSPGKAAPKECPRYVLRKNIDVTPFDFRLGGYELYHSMEGKGDGEYGGFFEKLKNRIERLYAENGNEKVAMVTHSLGGPLTLAFLNTYVDAEWKETHVKKVITIAAPFGGAIKALQATLLGESESFLIPNWTTQSMLSSWPGIYMVFPTTPSPKEKSMETPQVVAEIDPRAHEVLREQNATPAWYEAAVGTVRDIFVAQTAGENDIHDEPSEEAPSEGSKYTAKDLAHLLRMHPSIPNVYAEHLERLRPLFDAFRQPPKGVDIDCIYSTGIETTKKIIYKTFAKEDVFTPEIVTDEEGDGTVRLESLGLCRSWATDADIDVDMTSDEPIDLHEAVQANQTPRAHDPKRPIRRTIQLEGINHVDIVTNAPEVWDFILQSVNAA